MNFKNLFYILYFIIINSNFVPGQTLILEVHNKDSINNSNNNIYTDLATCLKSIENVHVLERNNISSIFKEQTLQLTGVTEESIIKAGKLLNADHLVFLELGKKDFDPFYKLKIANTLSAEVLFCYSDILRKQRDHYDFSSLLSTINKSCIFCDKEISKANEFFNLFDENKLRQAYGFLTNYERSIMSFDYFSLAFKPKHDFPAAYLKYKNYSKRKFNEKELRILFEKQIVVDSAFIVFQKVEMPDISYMVSQIDYKDSIENKGLLDKSIPYEEVNRILLNTSDFPKMIDSSRRVIVIYPKAEENPSIYFGYKQYVEFDSITNVYLKILNNKFNHTSAMDIITGGLHSGCSETYFENDSINYLECKMNFSNTGPDMVVIVPKLISIGEKTPHFQCTFSPNIISIEGNSKKNITMKLYTKDINYRSEGNRSTTCFKLDFNVTNGIGKEKNKMLQPWCIKYGKICTVPLRQNYNENLYMSFINR
ncbi:MAG: hypothetical protein JW915_10120 [Chitinispirillaceae bacterium]|nr:hypothetical protein [Chitinispirillaceae bacterium]